ncbi:hypothetical protein AGDE_15501 [Angomonas deanei]|uniref:Uncharacterized protein n=1 Tax=Angomonas deanei TaxID=59799 RepID=A0A7G2CNX6_9TRYP|nr:hypothetical protein AGDE_15501 [Angomonas deanei]CAD2221566.1 hypothetical protein, conserved [Angomonas deanei]|eukprot:EPY18963.1 hypothetical protein AGDE_15501 [Angomonas deanei]
MKGGGGEWWPDLNPKPRGAPRRLLHFSRTPARRHPRSSPGKGGATAPGNPPPPRGKERRAKKTGGKKTTGHRPQSLFLPYTAPLA